MNLRAFAKIQHINISLYVIILSLSLIKEVLLFLMAPKALSGTLIHQELELNQLFIFWIQEILF
jgi:hypothetical protein